jgi:pimeloyl-ACP methyl ester carboxylesterase
MTKPVPKAVTLVTEDGVPIDAVHVPGDRRLAFVVAHGFTLYWCSSASWQVAQRLNRHGGVVAFDFRGHGRSGGESTLGDKEVEDLDAAIRYARELGYERIATVGFSMGASIVLRHAGLIGGADAVVSVSGPGRWYFRGTMAMRKVHWAVERRIGRMIARTVLHTRISGGRWDPVPVPPADAAARISPTPLLIVHGDKDEYFPVDHAEQLFEAAHQPKELWIIPGFGHAETAAPPSLLDRIARWARTAALAEPGVPAVPAVPAESAGGLPAITPDVVA